MIRRNLLPKDPDGSHANQAVHLNLEPAVSCHLCFTPDTQRLRQARKCMPDSATSIEKGREPNLLDMKWKEYTRRIC